MAELAQALSWGAAALIQIVLGCAVAVALSLTLQPARLSRIADAPGKPAA